MSYRDRKLLRELSNGQRKAYSQVVETHYERIYAFLYRMTRDVALAEDMTQETFATAWRSLGKFEGRASLATWMHTIALNVCREYMRREHPHTVEIDEETLVSPDPTPELIERLGAEEMNQKVQQAVDALPLIYREVVVLRCTQGLKYREVADILGLPMGTVKTRLFVAFEKLRTALREEIEASE